VLHLHGLDDGERLPGPHRLAGGHVHGEHRAGHGGADGGVAAAGRAAPHGRGGLLGQRPGLTVPAEPGGLPVPGAREPDGPAVIGEDEVRAVEPGTGGHRPAVAGRDLRQSAHPHLGVPVAGPEAERRPRPPADPPPVRDFPRIAGRPGDEPRERGRGEHLGGHGGRAQRVRDAFGERRVQVARPHVGVAQQRAQERGVRRHAEDDGAGQRRVQPAQRRRAVLAPGDDLGEHRVVGARDRRARGQARVHADVLTRRLVQRQHRAPGRQEAARRVLRVHPRLERVAAGRGSGGERQGLARGHPELPLDQVKTRDELRDRVLDLEAGVHLHEEEVVGIPAVHDELDRARAHVADAAGRLHGGAAHRRAAGGIEER
jgi:hypothetical protein